MRPRWRLILGDGRGGASGLQEGAAGATNMAVDQALLEGVREGAPPALRFYRWSPGCLSFGRNQPVRGRYDADAARSRGIDIVRRPTGGLAVYHERELTYAVAAPVAAIGKPRAAYRTINRGLADGLARLGVPVRLVGDGGPGGELGSGPCFHEGAPGEVLAEGRKLVGSAQRSEGRCILQHGSILLDGDQAEVVELELTVTADRRPRTAAGSRGEPRAGTEGGFAAGAGSGSGTGTGTHPDPHSHPHPDPDADPDPDPDPAAATTNVVSATSLAAVGCRPSLAELVDALVAGLGAELKVELEEGRLTAAERARAEELESFYRSSEWTWRR